VILGKFPDGTPIAQAYGKSLITGASDIQLTLLENDFVPEAIGVPKDIVSKGSGFFSSKIKVKSEKRSIFGKIKLNEGESITLTAYFGKMDVSSDAFISCSYNPEIVKLNGNREFKAFSKGETQIGVLYYDGKETYTDKITVIVK
jgi:hypothetical protein